MAKLKIIFGSGKDITYAFANIGKNELWNKIKEGMSNSQPILIEPSDSSGDNDEDNYYIPFGVLANNILVVGK